MSEKENRMQKWEDDVYARVMPKAERATGLAVSLPEILRMAIRETISYIGGRIEAIESEMGARVTFLEGQLDEATAPEYERDSNPPPEAMDDQGTGTL